MGSVKPGSKPERDRLCREMLSSGCSVELIVEEMVRRWSFRPRQAWRYANRLSQDDVAARYNELADDPDARMTGKRISDYESWPYGGARPAPRVLAILALVYGTSPERLIDLPDREHLSLHDMAALMVTATTGRTSGPAPAVDRSRPLTAGSPGPIGQEVITAVAKESSDHAGAAEQSNIGDMSLEQLRDQVVTLARATGQDNLAPLFPQLVHVRNRIYVLLEGRQYPRQTTELYFLAGIMCGIFADVSDCFGYPGAALEQTRAAWAYAEIIDQNSLRAWCRVMQISLACREGRPQQALALARSGQKYAGNNLSRARLHTAEGMALAQLGDKDTAIRGFHLAQDARDRMTGVDELFHDVGGTFESPAGKAHIASATGYLSLGLAKNAKDEASTAIDLYLAGPDASRDYANEAQAHILLTTAMLQAGEPDGARETLRPVLDLPADRRVGWLGTAMRDLQRTVRQSYSTDSAEIREMHSEIEEFLANMLPDTLSRRSTVRLADELKAT
jgi:tetratricopeptide (TPR) repeat protein/transcriptional regulator with XRE-family HTH domain